MTWLRARLSRLQPWQLVLLALVAFLVVPIGGGAVAVVIVKTSKRQREVRVAFRAAGVRFGVNPDLMDAVARVESTWNPLAVNNTGGDAKRGGSFGASQMSVQTLREHHAPEDVIEAIKRGDVAAQAEWTARLLTARPGGTPVTAEDVGAWWNAGRTSYAAVPQFGKDGKPHRTRAEYVPRLLAALDLVRANPVA